MKLLNISLSALSISAALTVGASAATLSNGGFESDLTGWDLSSVGGSTHTSLGTQSFDTNGDGRSSSAAAFHIGTTELGASNGIAMTQEFTVSERAIYSFTIDVATKTTQTRNADGGSFALVIGGVTVDSFAFGRVVEGTPERTTLTGQAILDVGSYDFSVEARRKYMLATSTTLFADDAGIMMSELGLADAPEDILFIQSSQPLPVFTRLSLFSDTPETVVDDNDQMAPVPVPASLPLLLAGMGGIFAASRRKKARAKS